MQSTPEQNALHPAKIAYLERFGHSFSNRCARFLIECSDMKSDNHILDVASGPGTLAFEVLCKYDSSPAITGVDVSSEMLREARYILAESFSTLECQVDFMLADAHNLPFENDIFDIVLSNLGIHLFQDKGRALQEMNRVLRPGGRLGLTIPYLIPSTFEIHSFMNRLSESTCEWIRDFQQFTGLQYSIDREIRDRLQECGFTEIDFEETVVPYACHGAQEAVGLIKTVLFFSGRLPSNQAVRASHELDNLLYDPSILGDGSPYAVQLGVVRMWSVKQNP